MAFPRIWEERDHFLFIFSLPSEQYQRIFDPCALVSYYKCRYLCHRKIAKTSKVKGGCSNNIFIENVDFIFLKMCSIVLSYLKHERAIDLCHHMISLREKDWTLFELFELVLRICWNMEVSNVQHISMKNV